MLRTMRIRHFLRASHPLSSLEALALIILVQYEIRDSNVRGEEKLFCRPFAEVCKSASPVVKARKLTTCCTELSTVQEAADEADAGSL